MKCLLKLLVFGVLGLALLIGAGIAFVDPMVQAAVTEGVGYTTQQETKLDNADIGIFSGEVAFEGLEIANPPGFQDTPLLRIGRFQTVVNTSTSSAQRIEVDVVELKDLELALELKGTESNVTQLIERLQDLQKQLEQRMPPTGGEAPSEPTGGTGTEKEPGPEVGIQRIEIAGVKASLRVTAFPAIDGTYALDMPPVVLENFDSSMDHATMVEWTAYVLEEILASALTEGQGKFPSEFQGLLAKGLQNEKLMSGDFEGVADDLEDRAKDELDEIIKGAKEDPAKQLGESLDKLKKNADALDGLFGGKKKDG